MINCPNCGEPWSVPEVADQECWECGYPNHDTDTEAVEFSAGLVHEIPHSGRGLTTFSAIQNDRLNIYNPLQQRVASN